jgi:hypothetical protein
MKRKEYLMYILLPFILIGQEIELYTPNTLANSAYLSEDFRLFVPDTATQILFNPARASNYCKSFIYFGAVRDDYSSSPANNPFNFNLMTDKWLVSFSNSVSNTTRQGKIHEFNEQYYMGNRPFMSNKDYDRTHETYRDESKTSISVTRLFKRQALGCFLYYYPQKYGSSSDRFTARTIEDSSSIITQSDLLSSNADNNLKQFDIGLSYSFIGKKYEMVNRLSLGLLDEKRSQTVKGYTLAHDSTIAGATVHSRTIAHETIQNENNQPLIVKLFGYLTRRSNLIANKEQIFLKISGYYYENDIEYYNFHNRYLITDDSVDQLYAQKRQENGYKRGDTFNVRIALGWLVYQHWQKFYVMAGIKPQLSYYKMNLKGISEPGQLNTIDNHDLKDINAYLELPVYIDYTPAPWVTILGGATYRYIYNLTKQEIYNAGLELTNDDSYYERDFENEESNFLNNYHYYIGGILKHPNGIRLHLSMTNLSSLQLWNASIGYHF